MISEPRVKESERRIWCYSFKASKLWLTAIQTDKSGSKHTEREYCRGLKAFCDWIGKTPDQLITERKAELKDSETEMNTENKLRVLRNTREQENSHQNHNSNQIPRTRKKLLCLQ